MILIQRYIFKELIYNFLFTFVVITMIMLLVMAVKVIHKVPWLGFQLLITNVPILLTASLTIIVPAAVLVATVMTYGRISSDNEIVTMRASGIHVFRILVPGILLGLLTSFGLLVINDRIVPKAERHMKFMLQYVNLSEILDARLKSGVKELELEEFFFTWDSYKKLTGIPSAVEEGTTKDCWLFMSMRIKQYDEAGDLKNECVAESGAVTFERGGGQIRVRLNGINNIVGSRFQADAASLSLDLDQDTDYKVRVSMRTLHALAAMLQRPEGLQAYPPHVAETEIHKRIADSFSPIVFIFLALPVALLIRQQNRMVAFLIAIIVALFIYYPVSLLGEIFAQKEYLTPALCLWPGNLGLIGLGLFMITRVMKR